MARVTNKMGTQTMADQRDVIEALHDAAVLQTVQPVDHIGGHCGQLHDYVRVVHALSPIRPVHQDHVEVR